MEKNFSTRTAAKVANLLIKKSKKTKEKQINSWYHEK